MQVLTAAFARDDGCMRAAKDAWEHFINLRDSRPAELLAKFFDAKLRGEKGVSDEVTTQSLIICTAWYSICWYRFVYLFLMRIAHLHHSAEAQGPNVYRTDIAADASGCKGCR